MTKYGKDVVDLVKANPDRLGFLLRDKARRSCSSPHGGSPHRLARERNGPARRATRRPRRSARRPGIDFTPVERSDPGRAGAESEGRLHIISSKMETSRLIEVTNAHSRVVDQIQVTLEASVRGRQRFPRKRRRSCTTRWPPSRMLSSNGWSMPPDLWRTPGRNSPIGETRPWRMPHVSRTASESP